MDFTSERRTLFRTGARCQSVEALEPRETSQVTRKAAGMEKSAGYSWGKMSAWFPRMSTRIALL
jgi:hypothetical protein